MSADSFYSENDATMMSYCVILIMKLNTITENIYVG